MDSALWARSMDQWFRAKCDVKHTVVHRDHSGLRHLALVMVTKIYQVRTVEL